MIPRTITFFLIATLCSLLSKQAYGEDYPKLAPYTAIRWNKKDPEIQLGGDWFVLKSINNLPVTKIIAFAKKKYGGRWQKRFDEDLVQVLIEMNHAPKKTVSLVVSYLKTGTERTLNSVPMTEKNRQSIMHSKYEENPRASELKSKDLHTALDDFEFALDERWSYRHANDVDFDSKIDFLHKRIDAGISSNDFAIQLQRIIAQGLDGHASVDGYNLATGGYLPFLIEPVGEHFVAFKPDRGSFLAIGLPYLRKIDGKDVSDWCKTAAMFVPKGSPQYVRRHCLRHLRNLDYMRGLLHLPTSSSVVIELASEDGKSSRELTLTVASRYPTYGKWPIGDSRLLNGTIGYLRLAKMDRNAVEEIRNWMHKFRDTKGLVVDVRGNGGGSRQALRLLYSYLAAPEDSPRVVNAAAYRIHWTHKEDHLANRFMYRANAEVWIKEERKAIAEFVKSFRPEWKLPKDKFSDWHYMVLSRLNDPNIYYYKKPVFVLMDTKCFSATDIFLAGLKGLKNVVLLGTLSGGGSAGAQNVSLGTTQYRLRIGSMASFQVDGRLFDGNGVEPDVKMESTPEYYIGGLDNVLETAVKRIEGK